MHTHPGERSATTHPLWTAMMYLDAEGQVTTDESAETAVSVIILEAFHPLYSKAQQLMEIVAEPMSRTEHMHLYKLTENSLYTSVTLGMHGERVLARLDELSRIPLSEEVKEYVMDLTERAGKVKLVLSRKRVLSEVVETKVLNVTEYVPRLTWHTKSKLVNFLEIDKSVAPTVTKNARVRDMYYVEGSMREVLRDDVAYECFEVRDDVALIEMKKFFKRELKYPLDCVYDFASDLTTTALTAKLKDTARLRPYQSLTLSKTISQGRSRSGLIVLPCGAGKTLVGVSIATLIGKSAIIVCLNTLTALQWAAQFRMWTDVGLDDISMFTSGNKAKPKGIVITTYSMLGYDDELRAKGSHELIEAIRSEEWGTMIMDEVHVAPAATCRMVLNKVRAHTIIGLTATLLREDDKIEDLHYLVGPKLFEANWRELQAQGYLADVSCFEIVCPMSGYFLRNYLTDPSCRTSRSLVPIMNPSKVVVTQALVHFHRKRGDKILLFSDRTAVVDFYAKLLHIPQITGNVVETERVCIVNHIKHDATLNAISLSSAAETGTDIPDANVIIQLSGAFGSQRQETQRLGRILRPKYGGQGNTAWFYSLVSRDTREPKDNDRRRRFLLEQGYAFHVIDANDIIDDHKERFPYEPLRYERLEEHENLWKETTGYNDYDEYEAGGEPATKRQRKG